MQWLPLICGIALLLQAIHCLALAAGKNVSFRSAADFATWHTKYSRTMRMLGLVGLLIGSVFLAVGITGL